MKVVNLMTKTIQIKPYTICNLHQLGEAEFLEQEHYILFFLLLSNIIKVIFVDFGRFFSTSICKAGGSVYVVSYLWLSEMIVNPERTHNTTPRNKAQVE